MGSKIAEMKKAELHCHIEGAARPALAMAQARRYGENISDIVQGDGYVWSDFTGFLRCYDRVARLFKTREDYTRLAEAYLRDLAEQNCIYSEIFISTDHAIRAGLDPFEYIEGLADGIQTARTEHGIECRMIATGVRHEGPESVLQAAKLAADNPHPLITGWGMAGDERVYEPGDFAKAFDIARDAGLGITVHAGEFCGPDRIRETLECLRPARLGHGVRAIEDSALVNRIVEAEIVLEVCPGSNVALGVYANWAAHPAKALYDQGVLITLNSDDPPHFNTSIGHEYESASARLGFDAEMLRACTRNAISAAFCADDVKVKLRSAI
ncbi:MAG: adenosine deaminase [Pseudomonadota bacterium]